MAADLVADVIVVGGGTAGAVVAHRLVRAGAHVMLLEAGPDPGPCGSGLWPADLLDPARVAVSHDWGYSGAAADGRVLPMARARVLGGCSAHNGCTQSIGWHQDWDELGIPALTAAQVRRVLPTTSQALHISTPDTDELSPFQQDVLGALAAFGPRRTDDLLDLHGADGTCVSPVNVTAGIRWNNAFAFLDPERDNPLLTVVDNALVDRIIVHSDTVVGVDVIVRGARRRALAPTVCLCAGAFGSPEVLLRSGIGPVADLEELDIRSTVDLPAVGTGIADHPVAVIRSEMGPALAARLDHADAQREVFDEAVVAKIAPGTADAPYSAHFFPWSEPDPAAAHRWSAFFAVALLRPRSRGTLTLRSSDPTVRPAIDHSHLSKEPDIRTLLDSVAYCLPAWSELDLDHTVTRRVQSQLADHRASTNWLRRTHGHYWHPVGGAAAGSGDTAVVDEKFRVRGLDGLFVADASVFSHPPRATTAMPVTILAWQAATMMITTAASGEGAGLAADGG